tara:strand:+ start:267 stop:677 length:411 start_codon:yes stop_codon:yes gene_type:complete
MNNFSFNQIYIGQNYSFQKKIDNKLINQFVKSYGDINPLHNDSIYAKKKNFNNILVPGMLSSSFFSKLVGVFLPGKKCLFLSNHIDFINPIYPEDTILVKGKVTNKISKFSIININAYIKVNKKICIKSKIVVKIL